jgi:hypothetical protein
MSQPIANNYLVTRKTNKEYNRGRKLSKRATVIGKDRLRIISPADDVNVFERIINS